jgi:hypothetical protein
MKTNFILPLLVLLGIMILGSCNQNPKPAKKQEKKIIESKDVPVLTFLNRRVDVGKARKDSSVIGKYYFTNTGNKKLVIDYVNPDCSCTGFYLTKQEIEPGDSSCLVLKMSTKNKQGEIQINATISANTPTHFYKVSLLAEVL